MWTKRKLLKREERKEIKTLIGPFSLSRSKFKRNCKTKYSCASIFVQEVPRIYLNKIWHGFKFHFSKYAKYIYMAYSFPFPKIHWNYFQNTKPRLWWASTFHKLPIYALITKFGNVELLKLFEIQIIPLWLSHGL